MNSSALSFLYGPALTSIHNYWKNHSLDYMDLCWQSNVSVFQYVVYLTISSCAVPLSFSFHLSHHQGFFQWVDFISGGQCIGASASASASNDFRIFPLELTGSVSFQEALVVKNLPANAGEIRVMGSIPGSGRSPGRRYGNPLQYSCLKILIDREAWRARVHRATQS